MRWRVDITILLTPEGSDRAFETWWRVFFTDSYAEAIACLSFSTF